ncbi:MAG: 1-deoxy-D-xylulose-5-phosphate reductoisomerase, partial [Planctomycetota bacterium]
GFSGQVLAGADSLVELAALDEVDIVVCAVVGAAGLPAALAAAKAGKTVAIANKEPLVIAGELLTTAAQDSGATILPIDSEHSAVFQAMLAGSTDEVQRIILTASGGPFRNATTEQMNNATVEQALNHPTWDMGPKITIDSATMMNKALEVIEAVWLFDMPAEKIDVLIHPESIIHSMVEFVDGSMVAQLGTPDMKVPIQYALTYPKRVKGIAEGLKLHELGQLNFQLPDLEHFKALKLGFEVAKTSGSAPVVFNAANEAAVAAFLDGQIRFGQIVELIDHCLGVHSVQRKLTLEELLEVDAWARSQVAERLEDKLKIKN